MPQRQQKAVTKKIPSHPRRKTSVRAARRMFRHNTGKKKILNFEHEGFFLCYNEKIWNAIWAVAVYRMECENQLGYSFRGQWRLFSRKLAILALVLTLFSAFFIATPAAAQQRLVC